MKSTKYIKEQKHKQRTDNEELIVESFAEMQNKRGKFVFEGENVSNISEGCANTKMFKRH